MGPQAGLDTHRRPWKRVPVKRTHAWWYGFTRALLVLSPSLAVLLKFTQNDLK